MPTGRLFTLPNSIIEGSAPAGTAALASVASFIPAGITNELAGSNKYNDLYMQGDIALAVDKSRVLAQRIMVGEPLPLYQDVTDIGRSLPHPVDSYLHGGGVRENLTFPPSKMGGVGLPIKEAVLPREAMLDPLVQNERRARLLNFPSRGPLHPSKSPGKVGAGSVTAQVPGGHRHRSPGGNPLQDPTSAGAIQKLLGGRVNNDELLSYTVNAGAMSKGDGEFSQRQAALVGGIIDKGDIELVQTMTEGSKASIKYFIVRDIKGTEPGATLPGREGALQRVVASIPRIAGIQLAKAGASAVASQIAEPLEDLYWRMTRSRTKNHIPWAGGYGIIEGEVGVELSDAGDNPDASDAGYAIGSSITGLPGYESQKGLYTPMENDFTWGFYTDSTSVVQPLNAVNPRDDAPLPKGLPYPEESKEYRRLVLTTPKDGTWGHERAGYPTPSMQFYFNDLRRPNVNLVLPATLTELRENYDPQWNKKVYFGRVDPVSIYKNTFRNVSVGFKLVAIDDGTITGIDQVNVLYQKLEAFIYMCYPSMRSETIADFEAYQASAQGEAATRADGVIAESTLQGEKLDDLGGQLDNAGGDTDADKEKRAGIQTELNQFFDSAALAASQNDTDEMHLSTAPVADIRKRIQMYKGQISARINTAQAKKTELSNTSFADSVRAGGSFLLNRSPIIRMRVGNMIKRAGHTAASAKRFLSETDGRTGARYDGVSLKDTNFNPMDGLAGYITNVMIDYHIADNETSIQANPDPRWTGANMVSYHIDVTFKFDVLHDINPYGWDRRAGFYNGSLFYTGWEDFRSMTDEFGFNNMRRDGTGGEQAWTGGDGTPGGLPGRGNNDWTKDVDLDTDLDGPKDKRGAWRNN